MGIRNRTAGAALVSAVLVLGLTGPVSAGADTSALARAAYANCTELNQRYAHGVMKRHYTKRQWTHKGATGKPAYRPRLYRQVRTAMDRDYDGIACEK